MTDTPNKGPEEPKSSAAKPPRSKRGKGADTTKGTGSVETSTVTTFEV